MSTSLNNLQFPILTFWSRFIVTGGQQTPIKLEITEKTDETFKSTSSQIQSESNNPGGFIEHPKILEELGFFRDLAFLDGLEGKEPIEKKPFIEYTKQDDAVVDAFKVDHKQIIANSCENGKNSNHSTKEISPGGSKGMAKRNLNRELYKNILI